MKLLQYNANWVSTVDTGGLVHFPAVYGLKGLKGAVYQNLYFINNKYHSMFIVSLD